MKSIWFATQQTTIPTTISKHLRLGLKYQYYFLSLGFCYFFSVQGCVQLLWLLRFGQCDNESQRSVMKAAAVFECRDVHKSGLTS